MPSNLVSTSNKMILASICYCVIIFLNSGKRDAIYRPPQGLQQPEEITNDEMCAETERKKEIKSK